jgi:hypothetical protein
MILAGRTRFTLLLLIALLPSACMGSGGDYVPPSPPPESAARDLVNHAVNLALNHDFDQLCALGTLDCKQVLNDTGTDTVPTTAPMFVSVSTIPNRETSPGTWAPGGVLFRLCGLDGKNQAYRSEMLVLVDHQGTGLVAEEPVFWGSLNIGSTVAEPSPNQDATSTWQGCPS